MNRKVSIFVLVILVFIIFSCKLPNNQSNIVDPETGSLLLSINESGVRSILPDIEMTVDTFDIYGIGPNGASFEILGLIGGNVSRTGLVPGSWIITVNAKNTDSVLIASGLTSVDIEVGQTANTNINVKPLDGFGELDLMITWPVDTITNVSIVSTLTDLDGLEVPDVVFVFVGNTASYNNSNLESGYYELNIQLTYDLNGVQENWGIVESVRIVANQSTNGTFNLIVSGDLTLTVEVNLQNPIDISFTGNQSSITMGNNLEVSAEPSSGFNYRWYLNGIVLPDETSSSITYGVALELGNYRLDLLVSDENMVSSNGFSFSVEALIEGPLIIDHTSIALFDSIPQAYIDEVKKLLLILPGESHGTAYGYGLELVEDDDSKFNSSPNWLGAAEVYTDQNLRWNRAFLDDTFWNTTCGEGDFFTNSAAIADTLTGLESVGNDYLGSIYFGFGWCWDMAWINAITTEKDPVSGCGWAGTTDGGPDGNLPWGIDDADNIITGNTVNLQTYLDAVDYYNVNAPRVKTFFTTGPVDNEISNEYGYQRHLKHEAIREYVQSHGGILLDYADILSWDYVNNQSFPESWTDGNSVTHTWNGRNSALASGGAGYNGGNGESHITIDGCLVIGKAIWVMLALDAGWDGN